MRAKDLIPAKDFDFDSFQSNLIQQLTDNEIAWHIDATELSDLLPLQTEWQQTWAACIVKENASMVQRTAKKSAKKAFIKALRPFIQQQIQLNKFMADEDRMVCGIQPRKHTKSKATLPHGNPIVTLKPLSGHWLKIYCRQTVKEAGSSLRAKPKGVEKIKVVWVVSNTPPLSPTECPNVLYMGKTDGILQFTMDDAGKHIYGFACWVNSLDKCGVWSAMFSGVV